MKRIVSILIVLVLCVNSITLSYAGIFSFFKPKTETIKEFPLKTEGKYLNYINYAVERAREDFKKEKYDLNSLVIDYQNVIWEKEERKENIKTLKDDKPIVQYLICIIGHGTKKIKKEEIQDSKCFLYLCSVPFGRYKGFMSEILVEMSELDLSNSESLTEILEGGTSMVAAGAAAGTSVGAAIGSVVPVAGTAAGAAVGAGVGSLVGFLGGAGSKIFGKWKKDKKQLNELVRDLPEDAYNESLINISASNNVEINMVKENNLNQYLDSSGIELLDELRKQKMYKVDLDTNN